MYDIIAGIIDHAYQTNYGGDQQYIYYIAGALIIVWSVAVVDAIKSVWRVFLPRRKE